MLYITVLETNRCLSEYIVYYNIIISMRLQHEIDLGRPDNTLWAGFPERHDLFVRRNKVIIALFPPRMGSH